MTLLFAVAGTKVVGGFVLAGLGICTAMMRRRIHLRAMNAITAKRAPVAVAVSQISSLAA